MPRLFEAGLTVLLVATVGVPAQANPTASTSTAKQPELTQPTTAQPTQPTVEAKREQETRRNEMKQGEVSTLSERDRIQMEHYLQRPLPPGVVTNQVSGF